MSTDVTSTETNEKRLLEIKDLASGYSGVPVIRGVDLHVNSGEVVAMLGPNGAGKTTTLLTISGLLKALEGSVMVLGEPSAFGAPHKAARRGLAHVPEDRSLFFGLTVQENLRLGLRGNRAVQAAGYERALELLPALKPLMGRRSGLLSGGEQQMLAMARALVSEPKLLLVDEMSLGPPRSSSSVSCRLFETSPTKLALACSSLNSTCTWHSKSVIVPM